MFMIPSLILYTKHCVILSDALILKWHGSDFHQVHAIDLLHWTSDIQHASYTYFGNV